MAFVKVQDSKVDIVPGHSIQDSMHAAGYIPDSFLYLVDGMPIPMDSIVPEDVEVTALRVASGG